MSGYNTLLKNIERYVTPGAEAREAFFSILREVAIKKRQFIVQPGFVCIHKSYVVQGAFRAFFLSDQGVEHTLQFAVEDWFISDFNSYINQTPASLFVEALENGRILQMAHDDVEALCSRYPVFERYFRIVAQKSFAFAQRRILSNIGKSAEQRYLEFYELYPDIVGRVPQYALASYLGMTPEFLSKIRKRLQHKS